jgi:hypothetical protein
MGEIVLTIKNEMKFADTKDNDHLDKTIFQVKKQQMQGQNVNNRK